MSLYEKILKEREKEERPRGLPLGMFHNLDSPALDRLLADAPEDWPGYGADLAMLCRYARTGSTNTASGLRYMSLKKKHPEAYAKLKAEAQGQRELV